jgi:hypothetical protein
LLEELSVAVNVDVEILVELDDGFEKFLLLLYSCIGDFK